MKKLARFTLFVLGCMLTFAVVQAAPSQAEKTLREQLLQFESDFTSGATSSKWKARRIKWCQEVYRASSPREFGKCLEILEDYIRWASLDKPKWKPRRKAWAKECSQAKSLAVVASRLLELEMNMKWSAFSPTFKKKRNGWRSALKDLPSNAAASGTTTRPNNSSRNTPSPKKIMTVFEHFASNQRHLVAHPHTKKLSMDPRVVGEWGAIEAMTKKYAVKLYYLKFNSDGSGVMESVPWYLMKDGGLQPKQKESIRLSFAWGVELLFTEKKEPVTLVRIGFPDKSFIRAYYFYFAQKGKGLGFLYYDEKTQKPSKKLLRYSDFAHFKEDWKRNSGKVSQALTETYLTDQKLLRMTINSAIDNMLFTNTLNMGWR